MSRYNKLYAPCDHIKKTIPDSTVDQDLINRIATEFRTLPSFENTSYEHKLVRHYSLQTNELLKCRWVLYKHNIEAKVFEPFEFPAAKDLHFHNGAIRFAPDLSISRRKHHKMQMKPGPGIDFIGQMCIPYEMFMKRGITQKVKDDTGIKNKSDKSGKQEETKDEKEESKEEKVIKKDVKIAKKDVKVVKKDVKVVKKDVKRDIKTDVKGTKKDVKTNLKKDVKGPKKDVKINSKQEDKN